MTLMLPAEPPHARSLTGVLPLLLASLEAGAEEAGWPSATSVVVVLIDGLGSANLAARGGHARYLAAAMRKKDVAVSVFPSTTAAALTSLTTGTTPGEHGIVGYRVRVPRTGVLANQLTGWEKDGLDPATWQRAATLFERAAVRGRASFVVSREDYRTSGFTRAAFRGSEFHSAGSFAERLDLALHLARSNPGSIVYAYTSDLDSTGHREGWESDAWISELETADAAVRSLGEAAAGTGVGIVVTADHGMIDVPEGGHILLQPGDPVLDDVAAIAGEPRMLHVYAEDGTADRVAAAWRAAESSRAWVMTRDEAVGAGLFGPVSPEVSPRIGDVLVAARGRVAYYDDRLADKGAQRMVGQHGSLTAAERLVPLIRLGAFARD